MHKSGRNDSITPGASLDLNNGMSGRKEDITLADYIQRKTRNDAFNQVAEEKKLTFEEWWEKNNTEFPYWYQINIVPAKAIWKAAQENK